MFQRWPDQVRSTRTATRKHQRYYHLPECCGQPHRVTPVRGRQPWRDQHIRRYRKAGIVSHHSSSHYSRGLRPSGSVCRAGTRGQTSPLGPSAVLSNQAWASVTCFRSAQRPNPSHRRPCSRPQQLPVSKRKPRGPDPPKTRNPEPMTGYCRRKSDQPLHPFC